MNFLSVAAETTNAASRDTGLDIALVGLVGVLIGALFGLAGTWMTTRQNARLTKLAELRRLYAEIFEQLGIYTVLHLTSVAVEETLAPFYKAMGTDNPTSKHLELLGEDNSSKYLNMAKVDAENTTAQLESANRLEHLKYQAQLMAPSDTALLVEARAGAKHGSEFIGIMNTALVAFGRRDLASGKERRDARRAVREIRDRSDFKAGLADFEAFKASQSARRASAGPRATAAEATVEEPEAP